ncbi:hypothetical protein K438DRAFT_1962757 [Mycena galopus ATCC 62051]|nr:hypothetical protein K438DRAFT_1962757 [Mycena galopus ATCC 62051]
MSVFKIITTFVQNTLISLRSFVLRLFMGQPASVANPRPLPPDPENCVITTVLDGSEFIDNGMDLEKGLFEVASPASDSVQSNIAVVMKHPTAPSAPTLPLSVVTNLVRTSARPPKRARSKSYGENDLPTGSRKPTPLCRMPVYGPPRPLVWFMQSNASPRAIQRSRDTTSPPITPLTLESTIPGESVDFAARIQSAFYKPRGEDDNDEAENDSVRDLFSRDSLAKFSLGDAMNIIKDLDAVDRDEDDTLSIASLKSSSAFADLLASIERNHPCTQWSDIVRFDDENSDAEDDDARSQWSDVFSLDEYTT